MRIAIAVAALLLAAAVVPAARAQRLPEPIVGYFGNEIVTPNLVAGKGGLPPSATQALTTIYNCTSPSSPANFGFSSTDLAATWGDEIFTISNGRLSTNAFTLFNGSASGLNLLTVNQIVPTHSSSWSKIKKLYQ